MEDQPGSENLKVSVGEQQARVKQLSDQLAKLQAPGMAAKLANYRKQQQEAQRLDSEITTLSESVRALQRAARDRLPVTFTVLDGNPPEPGR